MPVINPAVEAAAIKHQMPPSLIQALVNDLSGGLHSLGKANPGVQARLREISLEIGMSVPDMQAALSVDDDYICNFRFDKDAWVFINRLRSLDWHERFLMSCRLGLSMILGKNLIFNRTNDASMTPPQPGDWLNIIKNFMADPYQQIDLLLFQVENLGTPRNDAEKGGILLGISKLYEPKSDKIVPQVYKLAEHAKTIEPKYQAYLENARNSIEREKIQLRDSSQSSHS